MLFVDGIVVINETREGVDGNMERWRHTLESRGYRVSRSRVEYLHCCFSGREDARGEVSIEGVAIPKVEKFKHLGSTIQQKGDIDEDIN